MSDAQKLITFVVPCYNSEGYMRKCIESLLPAKEDCQIVIIDDGSTDNTGAIADAYATSFMVMGLDGTKEILKQRPELQAYIIYSDEKGENEMYMTEGIKDFIIP